MDEDKRRYTRFSFSEPVEYIRSDETFNGSIAGNVSLSGMSLKVQEFIPIGATLELQVRFGSSPKLVCVKGQVVRVRETLSDDCFEIGLKFAEDENCVKAVGEYVNACRSKSTNQVRS